MRLLSVVSAGLVLALSGSAIADDETWREVDPDDLVVMDLSYGRVLMELAPDFAPKHAERFRALVRAKFYDGQSFYRVIDGFVAQGGIGEGDDKKAPEWPALKAEFDRPIDDDVTFTKLGSPDLFANEVGHVDGFPVGRDWKEGRMWILHCPGTLAMARDNDPDTGGTEFYVPIGHGPRRLDRNLTAFGRVLDGMQYLQKLNRGDPKVESGVIQDASKRDPIVRVQMAADMPKGERPRIQVVDTTSKGFAAFKDQRRNPAPEFYKKVSPNLDICAFNAQVQVPSGEPVKKSKRR
ncbi:MAG: peptidylprolyl isomerase [Alphaproteobacteria bacterium]|mgnify:CR=1 FL=1|jgi:peptidylprolyl isomerase|nr:peptidylprolyl isomerase [Alphaproteobacteria bacterium]